jgi:argininosuccinate lyase
LQVKDEVMEPDTAALTARIDAGPSEIVRAEVLDPQFTYEVRCLLPYYVAIEKVFALEYRRMGLLSHRQAASVAALLDSATTAVVDADRAASMTDIAFALEQHVRHGLAEPPPAWHVDRSRNDFQACAQLMFLKASTLDVGADIVRLWQAAHRLAGRHVRDPMPGYTHFQAAQIISPGFSLAAFGEELLHSVERLLAAYDQIDASPLGAGAMAGQELPWDRERMARLLGFRRTQPSALTSVASRRAAAEVTAELSLFGVAVSRYVTDMLMWGGSDCGYIDLPDELSGISSAMPQKKNFPVLERIRGRSAHLAAFHVDVLLGQRNTPYTNLVEVSKEAGAHVADAVAAARSLLRLLALVLSNLTFRTDTMRAACERDFFGGFTLANRLTLDHGVPWRQAQVIAGGYVRAALARNARPGQTAPDLLRAVAAEHGRRLGDVERALREAFDVDRALHAKRTPGSTHPDAVTALLREQRDRGQELDAALTGARDSTSTALAGIDRELTES